MARSAARSGRTETYQHPEFDMALRPEVATQPQFRKRKPPATYRYDRRCRRRSNGTEKTRRGSSANGCWRC
jgi:hypothetical protein